MDSVETKYTIKHRTDYSIASDVTGFKILFVNCYAIGTPGRGNSWWLVDAGLPGSSGRIMRETERLFGMNNPPEGIILTHGHFDHVGALPVLMKQWPNVRVFAHPDEIPYLTGNASYPPPDPTAGDGAMSGMSWLFPLKPIDLGDRIHPLREDMELSGLTEWSVVHTPGHSPGHISLFRERDRRLIAGDAFVTTNQNSLYSALSQKRELRAAPAYLTTNWIETKNSIQKLADLEPDVAGTGHGLPFYGEELRQGLRDMLETFEMNELPPNGYYVKHPIMYSDGRMTTSETPPSYQWSLVIGRAVAGFAAGLGLSMIIKRLRKSD